MGPEPKYYAKTLIFVQSSGMGKSRLADAFGEYCPMINFILREKGTVGYPPADAEIRSFMCKSLSEADQERIMDSPRANKVSSKRIREEDAKIVIDSPASKKLKLALQDQQPQVEPASEKLKSAMRSHPSGATPVSKSLKSAKPPGEARNIAPPTSNQKHVIISSPTSEEESDMVLKCMAVTTWNHSIAVGLLQASFEICRLYPLIYYC
jgi:hypothetical protein